MMKAAVMTITLSLLLAVTNLSWAQSSCMPGAQLPCACLGGTSGVQVCQASGKSLGPCSCPTPAGNSEATAGPSPATTAPEPADAATAEPGAKSQPQGSPAGEEPLEEPALAAVDPPAKRSKKPKRKHRAESSDDGPARIRIDSSRPVGLVAADGTLLCAGSCDEDVPLGTYRVRATDSGHESPTFEVERDTSVRVLDATGAHVAGVIVGASLLVGGLAALGVGLDAIVAGADGVGWPILAGFGGAGAALGGWALVSGSVGLARRKQVRLLVQPFGRDPAVVGAVAPNGVGALVIGSF